MADNFDKRAGGSGNYYQVYGYTEDGPLDLSVRPKAAPGVKKTSARKEPPYSREKKTAASGLRKQNQEGTRGHLAYGQVQGQGYGVPGTSRQYFAGGNYGIPDTGLAYEGPGQIRPNWPVTVLPCLAFLSNLRQQQTQPMDYGACAYPPWPGHGHLLQPGLPMMADGGACAYQPCPGQGHPIPPGQPQMADGKIKPSHRQTEENRPRPYKGLTATSAPRKQNHGEPGPLAQLQALVQSLEPSHLGPQPANQKKEYKILLTGSCDAAKKFMGTTETACLTTRLSLCDASVKLEFIDRIEKKDSCQEAACVIYVLLDDLGRVNLTKARKTIKNIVAFGKPCFVVAPAALEEREKMRTSWYGKLKEDCIYEIGLFFNPGGDAGKRDAIIRKIIAELK